MPSLFQYFVEKDTYHSPGYSFWYEINWNVPAISGNNKATGYIVQHFSRSSTPPDFVVNDTDYYEAWEVQNGDLVDTGKVCDDCFTICAPLEQCLRTSLGTHGEYRISGDIYWIPLNSPLYNIVDSWSRETVKQTSGLKGSYEFQTLTDDYLVFKREPFIHRWSLITDDEVVSKLEAAYLTCYPEYKEDFKFLSDWLDSIFCKQPDRWQKVKHTVLAYFGNLNE